MNVAEEVYDKAFKLGSRKDKMTENVSWAYCNDVTSPLKVIPTTSVGDAAYLQLPNKKFIVLFGPVVHDLDRQCRPQSVAQYSADSESVAQQPFASSRDGDADSGSATCSFLLVNVCRQHAFPDIGLHRLFISMQIFEGTCIPWEPGRGFAHRSSGAGQVGRLIDCFQNLRVARQLERKEETHRNSS